MSFRNRQGEADDIHASSLEKTSINERVSSAGAQTEEPEKGRWGRHIKNIEDLVQSLEKKANKKMGTDGCLWVHERLAAFALEIRQNHSDYREYIAYHMLIYSTVNYDSMTKLDFLEPHSVEFFLEKITKELDEK